MEKMHDFEEKKWFVYLSDHHEGPFSLSDLQQRMTHGEINPSSYVWAEGMADWKVMTEVEGCRPLLQGNGSALNGGQDLPALDTPPLEQLSSPASSGAASGDFALELGDQQSPELDLQVNRMANGFSAPPASQEQPEPQIVLASKDIEPPTSAAPIQLETQAAAPIKIEAKRPAPKAAEKTETPPTKKRAPLKKGRIVFFTILLGSAALTSAYFQGALDPALENPAVSAALKTANELVQPMLLQLTSKFPALSRWISPIPNLDDVSPAEYEELRNAASANLEREGAKIALAVSNADLTSPVFYVASNLPDKTLINIYIQGVPDTLLNQLSFTNMVQAVIDRKLGKSPAIKLAEMRGLPRGQYEVYAMEADKQPQETNMILAAMQPLAGAKLPAGSNASVRLLASRSVFLGGLKDATYTARLKEYHDKLQQKATSELTEIKQMAMSLETSLTETLTKFKSMRKPARKKQWEEFTKTWSGFEEQLKGTFAKWTPEILEKEFFYGMLYKMLKETQQAVENVHNIQASFFAGGTDANTFDIKVGQATALAENSMVALKAKIEAAEKLQPTPNGMPRRDGL
jgi:hypothetical protein